MSRAQEVAARVVERLFAGRRAGNVEVHLAREEVQALVVTSYEIGHVHGKAARRADGAIAEAAEVQLNAIHGLAQYLLENEPELRAALVRGGRQGDRPDMADEIRELLAAWRDAGTAVRDAAVEAARS